MCPLRCVRIVSGTDLETAAAAITSTQREGTRCWLQLQLVRPANIEIALEFLKICTVGVPCSTQAASR